MVKSIKTLAFLICILITMVFLGANMAVAQIRCDVCGRTIDGTYYTSPNGRKLCPKDYEAQRLHCSVCGQAINSKYYKDSSGRILCPEDFVNTRAKCSNCGKPLTGKYYVMEGKQKKLCEQCHASSAPVCSICGKRILQGRSIMFRDGVSACDNCNNNSRYKCSICLCPVDRNGAVMNGAILSDGRPICKKHLRIGLTQVSKARAVYADVNRTLTSLFGQQFRLRSKYITVKLVDQNQMASLKGVSRKELDNSGLCKSVFDGSEWTHTIYLLSYYPLESCYSIISHEYAHAWQFENNKKISGTSLRFKEGFAQWVAYKLQQYRGNSYEMNSIKELKSYDYAKGFRDFLTLEKNTGESGVIQTAKFKISAQ